MAKAKIQEIEQTKKVGLFTICFDGMDGNEFEKFIMKFKDEAERTQDLQEILNAIQKMISVGSSLERYFQPEYMMNDHDAALPSEGGRERLYCLRMLDNVLIVGNSGIKTTNDEDADLSGYVTTVQKLDVLLKEPIKNSDVSIEEIKFKDD